MPPRRPVDRGAMDARADLLIRLSRIPLQAPSPSPIPDEEQGPASHPATTIERRRRTAWADLLQRVFEVDALRCPVCGGRMRILSAITEPDVARRILEWLDMPSRAPPLGKPKGGPDGVPLDESTPDLPWDDGPGFDFDQSCPGDR